MSLDWSRLAEKLLDPYELKARLFPGLLLMLPAILVVVDIYGPKNPFLAALTAIVAACGGPYVLASLVRPWGVRAQKRLYAAWGGSPTTILLRHGDSTLAGPTKTRYRQLIQSKLGLVMPTADEEKADPVAADELYAAAADLLRPLTSDKKKYNFVFFENISYGFNRNAHGIRWLGASIALIVCIVTLFHAKVLIVRAPFVSVDGFDNFAIADALTLAISALLLTAWGFHFNGRTVWLAGVAYAKRLWEALETVKKAPTDSGVSVKSPAPAKTVATKTASVKTAVRKKPVTKKPAKRTSGGASPSQDAETDANGNG